MASKRVKGTPFEAAVVLVTQHSASGARGIILTRHGVSASVEMGKRECQQSPSEHYGGPFAVRHMPPNSPDSNNLCRCRNFTPMYCVKRRINGYTLCKPEIEPCA